MRQLSSIKSKTYGVGAGLVGGFFATVLPKVALGVDAALPESALDQDAELTDTVGGIINVLLAFLGIVAVILFLYGGFLWMTAGGNEENVAKAKKIITATVIGLIIILISAAAVNFILGNLVDQTGADIDL
jgi:cytochrome bd-type quinol oxidase subunit 2